MKRNFAPRRIRLVLAGLVALFLLAPSVALADTITTFNISASPVGIGGTITVDVTNGTVTAVDITATGFTDFTAILGSGPGPFGQWTLNAADAFPPLFQNQLILLDFTTTTPSTLIGFGGGQITNGTIFRNIPPLNTIGITGTIVPVPEPPTLWLTLIGLGLVLVMRKRVCQRLSQAS